ncbi:hypothetical protein CE143_20425 [Photorhabdus luminescens]|uniref:Uncharacterized protein n=1 Tax=Photorhabdus akhurstii TaxID=171438 RepID=A0ABX8M3L8_9GAMM|nr:hypothetical protein C6H69_17825 [Photorhabdus luminescens]QXF35274.1 hypothetical protein B0X70_20380 [Photorhabdus akhurstii]UJD77105.1 hypothetical protein CE143_20425 [Photorhabdus luminescens]
MDVLQATLAFWQGLTYNTENAPSGISSGLPGYRMLLHRNDDKPARKLLPFAVVKNKSNRYKNQSTTEKIKK